MFRKMRRINQQLSENEALEILDAATHGVLAVFGDGGYPYAVPLSFVYDGGKIYFHCAREGHKLDAVKRCDKASFCAVSEDNILPEKYTTAYRSVIAFGRIRIADGEEIVKGLRLLGEKYAPNDSAENRVKEISNALSRVAVLVMDIETVTGKEAKELMNERVKKERE